MTLGIVGRKIGMTRIFQEDGVSVPVTVVEVEPNRVTQIKNQAVDGYTAVQITTGSRRPNRVTSAAKGHYAKAGGAAGRGLWEFRMNADMLDSVAIGMELGVSVFEAGQKVDVRGTSKGKGFAGVMKRHGFRGGRATHGNSKAHRKAGSIGQNQDPGRVFPGKKMAGHMGDVTRTQQNLVIVKVDEARNLLLIKGAVPGARGYDIIVQPSIKGPVVELKLPTPGAAPKPDQVADQVVDQGSASNEQKSEQTDGAAQE